MNKRISTRFFSKKQENAVAQTIQGRTTPNSGATPYQKGDVSTSYSVELDDNGHVVHEKESWLLECKCSMSAKQSFAIKKQWLEGIKEEAFQAGKMNYAVVFSFGPNQENYYILNEKKFKELCLGNEE